ncbi:chromosome partitioning protein [Micromonospora sp. NPDC023737]|uniref:MinD/ParA family ATP-binding protein n=1 Tax=unclassified Micromonospora TaxID=2617518 RepID=UPI0033F45B2B
MDKNADRAQVPGQQPEPERDIEPLWPPDPADPGAGGVVPPVPWQPGAPAVSPPSPADYPSLNNPMPVPGGWGATGQTGAVSGWTPPQPNWGPPADPPPTAPEPAPTGDPASDTGTTAIPAPPTVPGRVDLDQPFSLDPAAGAAPVARQPSADPASADPSAAVPAPTPDGGTGPRDDGPAVAKARPTTESPWAYPPQRPTGTSGTAHDEAASATPPIPAPPTPHPGSGQTYAGQTYASGNAGQAGSAPLPPPPDLPQVGGPPQGNPVPQQGAPVAPPPGPFVPSPGWYPPPWQQGTPAVPPVPTQQYQEAAGVTRVPPSGYADATWVPETTEAPTAEDFARRRQVRPADPVATMGVRAVVNKMGLLRLAPGRHEQELKRDIEMVRRNFGGLRQVTVVNPKGGAGKTVAILLLAMTFGQKRGGYVLAWDNNETQGTLGMRAQQDFHSRTVRDLLRDLGQFHGAHGRVGDLSQYVRSQGEGMFDVLASDESATGGEMLTAAAFAELREVVSRFYKLIFVDTGNNVRAQNWQASMDATDQLVVTMSARNDSAETAARMLDHLEQSGRQRLVRQAVTVVSMPPSRKDIDLPAIQEHFAARTRAVLLAPYERLIDSGEPIRYAALSAATRDAWLKIAAAVAEGL